MREQVIASRPRRAAGPAKGFVQRPVRRDGSTVEARSFSLGKIFSYVPTALKVVLAVLTLITMFVGYRVASSASMFQVRNVEVVGTARTSSEEIEGLVRRAASRTGVWRADLSTISAELGRLPGVRRAVVTRVLPDRLRVRVIERVPVAVVRNAAGHFVWVDEDGVVLGEMKASDQMPPFFIRGWNEDGTTEAGKENVERVQKYLEAVREWQAIGLAERVSEINLIDVHDVRAQLADKDSDIEVRLGGQDLGRRLKTALDVLDEYKQTPRGALITYVDLQGDRVVLGFSSGGKVSAGPEDVAATSNQASQLTAEPETQADTPKRNTSTSVKPTEDKKPRAGATRDDKKPREPQRRVR
ncbi:MAG TPA: FtsQ-type POTRA domain-containing protein [Pyrinomonadaceae bacterium]|nr:FtsQ-type POTRA domain-containing protein [Pyrinomonadaceae bacterium]